MIKPLQKLLQSRPKNARAHAERYKNTHFNEKSLASIAQAVALLPPTDNNYLKVY